MSDKDSLGLECQHGQLARACYVCEIEAELAEQCRINAMGAERELSALNRVRELEAVARLALDAMKYHTQQTRPIVASQVAIQSLRKTLGEAPPTSLAAR